MSEHDEHLPEDLRDIAARLSAARVTPSPLEIDELRRRHGRRGGARRSRQGRGFARVLRTNLVAASLTLGLVLTSGVGLVLASSEFSRGGGEKEFHWPIKLEDSSHCEYHSPWTHDWSWRTRHSFVFVIVTFDCRHVIVHIRCGDRPIEWQWGGGPMQDANLESITSTGPNGTPWLKVITDGTTETMSIGYS